MTNDDAFMAVAGVRYCLGRHSYAPSLCCEWLKTKWSTFKEGDRGVILRDINEHIAGVKKGHWHNVQAGWECDLRSWENFVAWVQTRDAASKSYRRALDQVKGEGGGDAP